MCFVPSSSCVKEAVDGSPLGLLVLARIAKTGPWEGIFPFSSTNNFDSLHKSELVFGWQRLDTSRSLIKAGDVNRAIICRSSVLVEPRSRSQIFLPFALGSLCSFPFRL